jgi:hypothetical protein
LDEVRFLRWEIRVPLRARALYDFFHLASVQRSRLPAERIFDRIGNPVADFSQQ